MANAPERIETARRLRDQRGWSVLPVKPGQKRPLGRVGSWKEFEKRRPTDEELESWFGGTRACGIGLVTGEISGVVVVDIDTGEDLPPVRERADEILEEAPTDLIAGTPSGGMHLFYEYPGRPVKTYADKERGVDVRGDGGFVRIPPAPDRVWIKEGEPGAQLPSLVRGKEDEGSRRTSSEASEASEERLRELLSRLAGVRRSGSGWKALCPAHDDTEPSLSIGEGSDERILLKCYAGCEVEEIVEALDLEMADLFPDSEEGGPGGDMTQKKFLVLLVEKEGVELFSDERDRAYALLPQNGHREVWPLGSRRFRNWLSHQYYSRTGGVPASSTLRDALGVIEGKARFEGETRQPANRFARHDGALWYDLADDEWRAVRITASGWQVVNNPPPLFRRYGHQMPQVVPSGGGDLEELLRPFLNVPDERHRLLVLVWVVTALLPDVARVILILWGPQGSAKTGHTRILRQLTDPSTVPLLRTPRGDAQLVQVLDHHAVPAFDNLSSLDEQTSDTLCRAVTGDGFSKRKLYSDDEDILYSFMRALILNGINVPVRRPDVLDRSVLVRLSSIPESERLEERELWSRFKKARPQIFGAMLDALSGAMARYPSVELEGLPRMADWTRWGCAVAGELGYGEEAFHRAYRENRRLQNEEAIDSHPVGAAVAAFMRDRAEWSGTYKELLSELEYVAQQEGVDTKHKSWPGSARWLSDRLAEVETNLREIGIAYTRGSRSRGGRTVHLEQLERQLELPEGEEGGQ